MPVNRRMGKPRLPAKRGIQNRSLGTGLWCSITCRRIIFSCFIGRYLASNAWARNQAYVCNRRIISPAQLGSFPRGLVSSSDIP